MAARSAVGASVWGPPLSNEKSLGNGTFESKFSHPNFNNRFDNSRAGGLPAQGPLHGPIGSGIKGAHTPPSSSQRQSNFATTFQNLAGDKTAQQEPLAPSKPSHSPSVDDQAFASAHLDSSLQQSIAQSSSLHPQTATPLATSAYPSSNMSSAQVALPPSPAVGNKLGTHARARDWMSQGGTTTAGWKAFHANEQQKKAVDIAQYKSDRPQAAPKPTSIQTYEIYRMGAGQVEQVNVSIHPDGDKRYKCVNMFRATPEAVKMIKASELEHPEDHQLPKAEPSNAPESRFFPKAAPASALAPTISAPPTINVQVANDENEAPPPAEQGLFEHDASQPAKVKFPIVPKVNLPGMKVQLPPRSPGFDKTFNSQNVFPPTAPRAKTGVMRASDLALRFGPVGHTAGAANFSASSKPTFDITSANTRPSAAQPARMRNSLFANDQSSKPVSKVMAEDECIDFPDFGSKPAVRIPTVPHGNHQLGYNFSSEMMLPTPPTKPKDYQSVDKVLVWELEGVYNVKLPGMPAAKKVDIQPKRYGGRSPANGAAAGGRGGFRGGRGGYAPRGARGDHGFANKFGGRNNHGRDAPAGPSAHRGGPGKSRGGSTAASSGTSSPKPRGWAPRSGQATPAGQ